jgi:class 3 adenylate cyclase
VDGEGPIDVVFQPEWPGNIDMVWQHPLFEPFLRTLSTFSRVILHDHRGVGLSSREVGLPNVETRVSDLVAVLRATATRRPVLIGVLASGGVHALLAAMHPRIPRALVWPEPMARYSWALDYPWGVTEEDRELGSGYLDLWGTDGYAKAFHEDEAAMGNLLPPEEMPFIAMHTRNACTPNVAARLDEIWSETDVRGVLGAVNVPTLLLVHDQNNDEVEYVASQMPAAEIRRMPGAAWDVKDLPAWALEIREFVGAAPSVAPDAVLATVLFTDIVGSTERQASMGDRAWKDLVSKHHAIVREALGRYGGVEIDTAGDGFYATFDGPAWAIRCALEISERVRGLGIEIRAGIHTGECQVIDNKLGGISVTIGNRISALGGPSDVLASQTVKDLVAGSGLTFDDAGEHELKDVPNSWHIYRVVSSTQLAASTPGSAG